MAKTCPDSRMLPSFDQIKILFCDLDGTIVREDNTISETMYFMIKKLMKQGVLFVPCTGRSYLDMRSCFPKDLIFPSVLLNGALFVDEHGTTHIKKAWKQKQVKELAEIFMQYDLPVVMFAQKRVYCCGNHEMINQCVQTYVQGDDPLYTGEFCIIDTVEEVKEDIMKVETVTIYPEKREACMRQLQQQKAYQVSSSLPFNIEITLQGVHKAAMVKAVLDEYKLIDHQALIFGDSDNDLQLFERFPNCIAVGNACTHIKEKAVCVIDSCEEDGVALFLDSYLKQRS